MKRTLRALGCLLLAGLTPGCAAFTTVLGPTGARPAPRPLPVAGTTLHDFKGVVHCHSHLSHDSDGTIEQIAAACVVAGLDFLVMTDHQTDESIRDGRRGMVGDTLFLVGAEVRSPQGTLLCFPLTKPLRHFQHPGLLAKEAAQQGGLAFVGHGERWRIPFAVPGLAGAEIVNLHAGVTTAGPVGTLATGLFLPMRMLMRRLCVRDDTVLAAWDAALAQQHPFTPVGGNDAHANIRVFGPLGGTIANYQEVFLTLSTHVLAERLDEASLVDALRQGRSYVSFDIFGEGAGFDFRAVDAAGAVHLGGATVPRDTGLTLRVFAPADGSIRLLRDGHEVARRDGRGLLVHDPAPGVYRVEVFTSAGNPWLFSSSIRVL
ncbi:MAG: hypothetical protein K8J09_17170 [Planctomycetes bacterium]|nr:hypothetical protein [Planctomycetota bacterium]MCC7395505.1 PHP domain-containing protein [Planctomycetota bacterium]